MKTILLRCRLGWLASRPLRQRIRRPAMSNLFATKQVRGCTIATALGFAVLGRLISQADDTPNPMRQEALVPLVTMVPGAPEPTAEQYVHVPPTLDDLEASDLHPKLKETIKRGHDLFINTQQLPGKNVFNDLNCVSCHEIGRASCRERE